MCSLHFTDDSFMKKNQHDALFAGRLKLKVEAVPTLKGHESEPQTVRETVLNVCVRSAAHVLDPVLSSTSGTTVRLNIKSLSYTDGCDWINFSILNCLYLSHQRLGRC